MAANVPYADGTFDPTVMRVLEDTFADAWLTDYMLMADHSAGVSFSVSFRRMWACLGRREKVPEGAGLGCSGIEQIWEEHVLDGEATLR